MPVRGRSYSDPTSLGIATSTATAAAACPAPRNGITTGNALAQALASRMAAESSKRDCSQEPVSSFSSDHDSVASDSKASDRSRAEDRRGPKARASRVSPARGPPVAKRSSGSSAPLPTVDSGSDSGARAPHRHQRSGYDSEGGGRSWGDRRRPRRGRSSSLVQEARWRRKSRKSCRSDSDSARSKDTDDSSYLDSGAASDRSLTQESTSTKGLGLSFSSKGAHAPSSGRSAPGSDKDSKRQSCKGPTPQRCYASVPARGCWSRASRRWKPSTCWRTLQLTLQNSDVQVSRPAPAPLCPRTTAGATVDLELLVVISGRATIARAAVERGGIAGVPAGAARAALCRKPAGGARAGNLADPTRTLQGRRIPTTRRIWTPVRRAAALCPRSLRASGGEGSPSAPRVRTLLPLEGRPEARTRARSGNPSWTCTGKRPTQQRCYASVPARGCWSRASRRWKPSKCWRTPPANYRKFRRSSSSFSPASGRIWPAAPPCKIATSRQHPIGTTSRLSSHRSLRSS